MPTRPTARDILSLSMAMAKVLHGAPRCLPALNGQPGGESNRGETSTMRQLIHEHSARVRGPDGTEYCARTCAESRADGTWSGWIEFVPVNGRVAVLSTDQETSQPDRKAIEYWAGGLEPVYLEGALNRALRLSAINS